jgi:hypothetical protein
MPRHGVSFAFLLTLRNPSHSTLLLHPTNRFGNIVIGLLVAFDFSAILCVTNFFGVASVILEVCSFIKLRSSMPHLERPFLVPVHSIWGMALLLIPPMCIAVLVVLSSVLNNISSLPLIVGSFLLGGVLATMWSKAAGSYERSRTARTTESFEN